MLDHVLRSFGKVALTVPHLLGTIKSLGSLSVNAMRLGWLLEWNVAYMYQVLHGLQHTQARPQTRVSFCG